MKKIDIQLFATGGDNLTSFLNLEKPLSTDNYNIEVNNLNMDFIDNGLKNLISFEENKPTNNKEQIWYNFNMDIIKRLFLDLFRPVGSYYKTSNSNFNPNIEWGGKWIQDSKGMVLVGYKKTDTDFNKIGKEIGEVKHKLIVSELPVHSHNSGAKGFIVDAGNTHLYNTGDAKAPAVINTRQLTANTGGNVAHNNIQPSIVVYQWHRIQ